MSTATCIACYGKRVLEHAGGEVACWCCDGTGETPDDGLCAAERHVREGRGVEVLNLDWTGGGHLHLLRVKRIPYPEGDTVYLEISEPGRCACIRRVQASSLVHALLNVTDAEVSTLEDRDACVGGHAPFASVADGASA